MPTQLGLIQAKTGIQKLSPSLPLSAVYCCCLQGCVPSLDLGLTLRDTDMDADIPNDILIGRSNAYNIITLLYIFYKLY